MYQSEYARMYHSEDKLWWYTGLRELLHYYIRKYGSANPHILDAGCGTGKNMEYLSAQGYIDIDGLDYSADAIAFCRKRGIARAQQGSITNTNYSDQLFDIVYCMDVLGSLDAADREAAVSEMFRVLKPGGLFLCNTAAFESLRSQHDEVCNIKMRFTLPQFRLLFTPYHPEILKLSYRVFLLSPLVFLFKLVKKLGPGVKKTKEAKSDQTIFPFGINWLLLQIQLFENRLYRITNFPFGSSVFIVLRKKQDYGKAAMNSTQRPA